MNIERWMIAACVAVLGACGSDPQDSASSAKPSATPQSTGSPTTAPTPKPTAAATPIPGTTSAGSAAPEGKPPPDGKYERVTVEGVTVPMIEVTKGGTVVLVDTDGKKPRTWEEQFKKKRDSLGVGQFDVHKTDANKDGKFDDDPIDKEGLWIIDEKGNITKH